jgi:hypothetical protein
MADAMMGKAEVTYARMMYARMLATEGLQGDAELEILIKALEQARQEGMDEAADTIEALRGEATSKGIRVSSPGEQDFSKYCLEITDDKGSVVKYALNADGTQGAAISDKAQEDEISWYVVVRERDGKVRALFDFDPAAKKWCDDWNVQSTQNPYFVVGMTVEQVRMLFTKPYPYGLARLATD